MPRKPRFNLVGILQHVIQCANNREPCFYSDPKYAKIILRYTPIKCTVNKTVSR